MSSPQYIPWFNPREMNDATVLALSTGRDALLDGFFQAVRQRLNHPEPGGHWLVTGPRGVGKSFFLRLVQTHFHEVFGEAAQFVLLPEEHSNIFASHEWLEEICRMMSVEQGHIGASPAWRAADEAEAWTQALQSLFEGCVASNHALTHEPARPPDLTPEGEGLLPQPPLLVIGVENFDQLLQQAFADEVSASRLRTLLAHEPRLLLLATAVQGDFDEAYGQRLFRQFEHHTMPLWDEAAHRDYLQRRAVLQNKIPSACQLARIQAYSRYTGGNARIAAVLAGAILDEQDPLLVSANLNVILDRMTDYYRALHARIPSNSRKLFDALIRGGEPASQSDIAERTGARQNEISRAFAWLVDYGYVLGEKAPGRKEWRYRVVDRLFVQFYHMRYLRPGKRSQLALLADFLADTIEFTDKWRYAERYLNDGHEDEARVMAELACRERSIDFNLLMQEVGDTASLIQLGRGWEVRDSISNAGMELPTFEAIFRQFSNDADFQQAYEITRELARAASRGEVSGLQLVSLLEGNLSLCPAEKYLVLVWMLCPQLTEAKWRELIQAFESALKKLEFVERGAIDSFFRKRRELGRYYPLACSFQALAEKVNLKFKGWESVGTDIAAHWSAKATVLWLSQQREDEAEESLRVCFSALRQLLDQLFRPDIVLEVFYLLKPYLDDLIVEQRARLLEYQGRSLEDLNRYAEAYQAYAMARKACIQAEAPSNATWNLQRMSCCQGIQGQWVEAIAGHRQAYEERIAQQQPEFAAWNLGQMARYTIRQASLEAAWTLLDSMESSQEDWRITALQQLGDALWDIARQDGEAKAFALGRRLLEGLAARPQYPTEPALSALLLFMISVGVPHAVLRDLLGEIPTLFVVGADLAMLRQILTAWLDDLDCPPSERAARRQTLNPDLATTLESLGQHLSAQAKVRLGLN